MTVNNSQDIPVNVVGSDLFGIYPKISLEKTYNLFESDGWLISYAGFRKIADVEQTGIGRGIFNSARGGFLIAVVNGTVYRSNSNLAPFPVGNIGTTTGDVFIDENLASQICIVDGKSAYIYNYATNTFTLQTSLIDPVSSLPFQPNYVCYHNTFFLFGSAPGSPNSSQWYAFSFATDTTIALTGSPFTLQTKPDIALAVERLPGRGNNVLVLGTTVAEVWTQVGGTENYRRVQSFNIDNGLVSASTLAGSDEQLCWLSQNENNSPVIMVTDGSGSKKISTDGIDNLLGSIKFPAQSDAFFYRQDGHVFYQITFSNPVDNLTLIHDFTTGKFFHVSDQNLNYHPARQVVYYNENTYFISINDGSLYLMDTNLVTYNYSLDPTTMGEEIPRIRICKSIRRNDSSRFRVGELTFWLEQGVNKYYVGNPIIPRVDMSFSKNGGQSFSNVIGTPLNPAAHFRNIIRYFRMGQCNEIIFQFRFVGLQRFVVGNGTCKIY